MTGKILRTRPGQHWLFGTYGRPRNRRERRELARCVLWARNKFVCRTHEDRSLAMWLLVHALEEAADLRARIEAEPTAELRYRLHLVESATLAIDAKLGASASSCARAMVGTGKENNE